MVTAILILPLSLNYYKIDDTYLHCVYHPRINLKSIEHLTSYPKKQYLTKFQAVRIYDSDNNSIELRPVDSSALIDSLIQHNPNIKVMDK